MKGLRLDEAHSYMSAWSECSFNLFNLDNYTLVSQSHDLCPGTLISDCLYAVAQEYCVCGTTDGQIYVYTLSSSTQLVHTFPGHIRGISSFEAHSDPQYFLSAGLDFSVKL